MDRLYPAPCTCKALVTERSALEQARDARAYNLADPALQARFRAALHALFDAEDVHMIETGCRDRH